MLILRTLDLEPRHGLGVADRIEQITQGTFRVKPGSLFPALHRLEQEGFIEGEWEKSSEGRRGKYYRLIARINLAPQVVQPRRATRFWTK
jgi:DNA-binding PadR family transcriptional regulator